VRGMTGERHVTYVPTGTHGPQSLTAQLGHVRRYWWLVLAVVALSVIGAAASTMRTPTTYTGRSSLIVASNDRSPDQDAVLVQGYVAYFNDPAYQSRLLATADLRGGVMVSAQAAAASPILLIDATTQDPRSAQSAAAEVATIFQSEINHSRTEAIADQIASLERQIKSLTSPGGQVAGSPDTTIAQLQDQILRLKADRVDQLQVLQRRGGVSQDAPQLSVNILLAFAGGLIIGVLAALVLGRLSNRVRTSDDLAERVGLDTLAEIPPAQTGPGERQRQQRVHQLANIVRTRLGTPAVLAVTEPVQGSGAATVAHALAQQWADENRSCLLLRTGGSGEPIQAPAQPKGDGEKRASGFLPGDLGAALNTWISPGPVPGMWILNAPAGPSDTQQGLTRETVHALVAHAASSGTMVVIDAGSVVGSATAQELCSAAGRTILVIEPSVTRVGDAEAAAVLLERSDAGLLGAVLLRTGGHLFGHARESHQRAEGWVSRPTGSEGTEHSGGEERPGPEEVRRDDGPFHKADAPHEPAGKGES
jgi:capsular polysaccharide biosynthesis protein